MYNIYKKCQYKKYWQSSSKQNAQNFTVTNFSTIFRNWDCYGKDAIFYTFSASFFHKFQKWTFLKCPKNDFRNTFVYLFLTFWVPYCKYKILSVLFVSLEYTIDKRKYNKSVLFMVSIFCCYFANTLPILFIFPLIQKYKVYDTIYGINLILCRIFLKNANTFCIGKVAASKMLKILQ